MSDSDDIAKFVDLPFSGDQVAVLTELVAALTEQNAKLREQVEELTRQLAKNSSDSHKPPSSDGPGKRNSTQKRKKKNSGKKRGGQPGHKGHSQAQLPPDQVDTVVNRFPTQCEICQQALPEIVSKAPYIHQVVDLLPDKGGGHVTEYRCHATSCSCGYRMPAPIEKAPATAFGPRLSSAVCMLSGAYHLSRRQVAVVLKDLYQIDINEGSGFFLTDAEPGEIAVSPVFLRLFLFSVFLRCMPPMLNKACSHIKGSINYAKINDDILFFYSTLSTWNRMRCLFHS